MRIIPGATGSRLDFYTAPELETFRESVGAITVDPEILQQRKEDSYQQYLDSSAYTESVQLQVDFLVETYYPWVIYDTYDMKQRAKTMELVRNKFDSLRNLNMGREADKESSTTPATKGRNQHISDLIGFMTGYIKAFGTIERKTELDLIKQLPSVLNKEFGNFTGIQDIPKLFFEGVGIGVGGIIKTATNVFSDVVGGIATGILGSDWQKKAIYLIIIVVIIIIVILIGVFLFKTYAKEKIKKIV